MHRFMHKRLRHDPHRFGDGMHPNGFFLGMRDPVNALTGRRFEQHCPTTLLEGISNRLQIGRKRQGWLHGRQQRQGQS